MDVSVSPRTQASLELKRFFNGIKIKSTIRSKVTKKKGFQIFVKMDELSRLQKIEFNKLIDDVKNKYNINTITVHEELPW